SGPLGSMVGHYETVIDELCSQKKEDRKIRPKIIASTATISRAEEQVQSLYARNVFLFPPQCLQAGNSFFAEEDNCSPGRLYAGVHASALPSHVTAQVRVIAALLQATLSAQVSSESERDPYWTLIDYFNSLRELGHAATLIRADIPGYLNAMWSRKKIEKKDTFDERRFINQVLELTSRVSSTDIPESLQKLDYHYPSHQRPVDICLATNMISVGIDVSRLGLMVVVGQPKTTSEYIQATSRVGREYPGLVIPIYNTGKPRDRSHYEHFRSFHESIYHHVEPTSVTPFAAPVRERALHALLVTLVRYWGHPDNRDRPQPFPDAGLIENIRSVIEARVSDIDLDELNLTLDHFEELTNDWQRILPPIYGGFGAYGSDIPLMYPAGSEPLEDWIGRSWATPSSMRNVDASCEAETIRQYPEPGEVD
ncbi:MAG: helicase-related protein, partial [Candidatus Poribacteria bacterium]|nr:helicase-related protein [Candidatus Poribacteria bacterium]